MCGIAGMTSMARQPLRNPGILRDMMGRLIHRGPDEEGVFTSLRHTTTLGHRRLRIIDLLSGRQPICNEDGSIAITFNGEIYGYQELQKRLQNSGHRFQTRTDTEVIVHLYEEEGLDCLQHLKGMFAFGIWDEGNERLFLARDRIGKKPLYYTIHQGEFIFASELQALSSLPHLSKKIDKLALDAYFALGYIPSPRTIFEDIKKLESGYYLVVESGEIRKSPYWLPTGQTQVVDWEEAKQEIVSKIRSATALRMVSDVPIGCFLSGGIDSSSVLSFMAELSSQPIKTFSIGFPEQQYSELRFAREVARHFGTDHHEYVVEPDAVTILDELVAHFGEPFADSSALPTWYLSQLTRQSVTVALTGDGGDEVFGGYNWYQSMCMLRTAAFLPVKAAKWISHLSDIPGPRLLKKLGNGAGFLALPAAQQYAVQRQNVTPALKRILYSPQYLREVDDLALTWLAGRYASVSADDDLNRAMLADLFTYMAEDLMVKVDRTSMAHSLECRSPLLDTDLVEWAVCLPSSYKIRMNRFGWPLPNGGKWILREAVRGRFPPGFLNRPKQGFSVPLEYWFRRGLRKVIEDRVVHGPLHQLGFLQRDGLQRVVSEHFSGSRDYSAVLWALLVLAVWAEQSGPWSHSSAWT